MALFIVGETVIEVDGRRQCGSVVVDDGTGWITVAAEVATGSNDYSCCVANPFEWLLREMCDFVDWEGETMMPRPVVEVEVDWCSRVDVYGELNMHTNVDRHDSFERANDLCAERGSK
jgi:hypothetical protein